MNQDVWIITDAVGFVADCSGPALQLLGYSARGARGRELPNAFVTNRPKLSELLQAARGAVIERSARLRPNDRRLVDVVFKIEPEPASPLLRWTFTVRWPVSLLIPRRIDRRQLITIWRAGALRCVYVPSGRDRRLLVCESDAVVLEETPADAASALARATQLEQLARQGQLL